MPCDEEQRKRILRACDALPEALQRICRLMSTAWTSLPITNLVKLMIAASVPMPDGKRPHPPELRDLLDELLSERVVVSLLKGGALHYAIPPVLAGPLWDRAVELGEFQRFNAAVNNVLGLDDKAGLHALFAEGAECVRALRSAMLQRDGKLFSYLWGKAHSSCVRYNRDFDLMSYDALANPVNPRRLLNLPLGMAEIVFPRLLTVTLSSPGEYAAASGAFFDYMAALREAGRSSGLDLLCAERLIFHGRRGEAERFLDGCTSPQCFALRALLALNDGDERTALALFGEGLAILRHEKLERPFYRSWAGMFYPLLLRKAGEEEKKIRSFLRGVKEWGTAEDLMPLLPLLKRVLKLPSKGDLPNINPDRNGLCAFPFLLMSRWLAGERENQRDLALMLTRQFDQAGLAFLSAELRAGWGLEGGGAAPHPLVDILKPESAWERSLSELSGIGGPSPEEAAPSRRVVWMVDWHEQRGGRRVDIHRLCPVEQTRRRNGWSNGRHIALKRLEHEGRMIEGITEQDLAAASAIMRTANYFGTEYTLDIPRALTTLAGHPLVFREDTAERVEITAREPQLTVQEQQEGYVLRLSPFPRERSFFLAVEEGALHLVVTRFEARHMRIADILGEGGLLIPRQARARLTGVLEALASVVTIHSDIEGVGSQAETVTADGRLYVQVQPMGPGLEAEAVVRPLGPTGAVCRPGCGGANLFGLMGDRRVQTTRDLEAETRALADFRRACPALNEGEQTMAERWLLMDPALALEFLSQLEPLGERVVVEWPRGRSMRLAPASVGEGSLRASIRRERDWFAVSGEVRVQEGLVLSMKTLIEGMNKGFGRFAALGDGQFLALTEEFRRRLETLTSLGDLKGDEIRLPPLAAELAAEALEGAGEVDASAEWRERLELIAEAERLTPDLPSTFRASLRSYQLEGFRWLMRLAHWGAGACLADDMGLGKTVQTLALLVSLGSKGPSLVVAPTSVCPNWMSEAARFAPTLNVKELRHGDRRETLTGLAPMDLVVVSYGILQNERGPMSEIPWNVIVLDEAQAIKNNGAKRSTAAMKLNGAFRVATTGTPIENQLSELWNIFRFLNPGYLGSAESFSRRFTVPIERDEDRIARAQLRRMIRPFILRRTKSEVLSELPVKTEITLTVDLKEEERAFYEALRRSALEELSGEGSPEKMHIFAALMRLRRACCSTSLVNAELQLPSAKLEAFADVLTELRGGGHKALVFSQFVDHLAILREWLDARGVPFQYLDGTTPQEERQRRVAAFQAGEGDCFLISLRAGGTGLNLTAADYVIHMDPWWNPAVEEQASDRAHRIGQSRPVTVYRIVTRDTVEEKIVALHAWKRDLADGLLEDSGHAVRLSAEELMELIRAPS